MEPIQVEVREVLPPPGEKKGWKDLLKENFVTVLSTVVTVFSGVLGYFFVTSFNHQLESSRLALDYVTKTQAMVLEREKMSMAYRRADLDAYKDSLKNSEIIREFVPKLLGTKQQVVEEAGITLAAAGASNTHILVAALGNSKQYYAENIIVGLRLSASRNHAETCDALCKYAEQLWPDAGNSTSIGNIAKAMGDLRCYGALGKLDQWKALSNDNVTDAVKRLSAGKGASVPASCGTQPG